MTASTNRTVVEAMTAVMADVGAVGKDGRNRDHGYSFRGIDAVVNACSPALRRHGVVVLPELRSIERTTVEVGKNRTLMGHAAVVVAYTFHGPCGDTLTAVAPGEAMDSGDKATAKAMSVAMRTALLQALCLPTDEPDPDEHSYERSSPPTPEEVEAKRRADEDAWADVHGQVQTAPTKEALKDLWRRYSPTGVLDLALNGEPILREQILARIELLKDVEAQAAAEGSQEPLDPTACQSCGGTGRSGRYSCGTCNGSGKTEGATS